MKDNVKMPQRLPSEILMRIFRYVRDIQTMINVRQTSSLGRDSVDNSKLLSTLVLSKSRRKAADRLSLAIHSGMITYVKKLVICTSTYSVTSRMIHPQAVGWEFWDVDDLYGGYQGGNWGKTCLKEYQKFGKEPQDELLKNGDLQAKTIIILEGIQAEDLANKYEAFLMYIFRALQGPKNCSCQQRPPRKISLEILTDETDEQLSSRVEIPGYLRTPMSKKINWSRQINWKVAESIERVLGMAFRAPPAPEDAALKILDISSIRYNLRHYCDDLVLRGKAGPDLSFTKSDGVIVSFKLNRLDRGPKSEFGERYIFTYQQRKPKARKDSSM